MLNIPVSKVVVLNEPRIRALIGQREPAGVTQHVEMGGDFQPGGLAIAADGVPSRLAGEGAAPLAHEQRLGVRLHPVEFLEPRFDGPECFAPQGVGGGQPAFQSLNIQRPAFKVDLRQGQPQGFGHPQPMSEHQQQQAPVAGLVAAALGGGNQFFDLAGGEVFAVVVHFVQCLSLYWPHPLGPWQNYRSHASRALTQGWIGVGSQNRNNLTLSPLAFSIAAQYTPFTRRCALSRQDD